MDKKNRKGWILICIFAVLFLIWVFSTGLIPAGSWVYLLLLACPISHVFMMRGGHHHGGFGKTPTVEGKDEALDRRVGESVDHRG